MNDRSPIANSGPGAWYLAIDLGTGGTKTAAVTLGGEVLTTCFTSTETQLLPGGGAIQDPATWWSDVVHAVRGVLSSGTVEASRCAAIGITGQWGSTIPVGVDGEHIGPCLMWFDGRGGPWSKEIAGGRVKVSGYDPVKLATWVRLTGGAPSPQGADPTGHAQYLLHAEPGLYAQTSALMEPVDYLGLRLTGRSAATPASMILSWLTDNRTGAPVAYHPKLVGQARRDRSKLPELLSTGSVLGPLCGPSATVLGLAATVPVVCGVPDLHTAWLGSGAVADHQGHLAISTSAWVSCSLPVKRTDVASSMATVPGLRPGSYLVANGLDTGGSCLRWFREQFLGPDDGLSTGPTPSYNDITAAAARVAPGSGGVIFAPWLKGQRSPVDDRRVRASFLNVSLETNRATFARSVLEGVALNARWMLEATEKMAKHRLEPLRILGGGAQSALWCQIHADVIGRPIQQVRDPMHTNVRGAALFAALSLGHTTLDRIGALPLVANTFTPDPSAIRAYKPLYAEFTRLYKQQKSMYARLNGTP